MRTFIYNLGYFLKETGKIIRLNLLSNMISVLGTGLILFLLGMVMTGNSVGNRLVTMLSEEAEISCYLTEGTTEAEAIALTTQVARLEGVREARLVSETEARERMKEVLGEEARILELFEDNPFEAFIEVSIHMEVMDTISDRVKALKGIDYVRDNLEVLEQIERITNGLKLVGYLVMVAVGITTIIILSHMIRQGIYNNKEQINTLRLLGAPSSFIGFPYVMVGLILTLLGGLIAAGALVLLINGAYGQVNGALPFMPMPPKEELVSQILILLPTISLILGLLGSLFGLSSIKSKRSK